MSYVDNHLMPGETVVYRTTLHWRIYIPALLSGILCLASIFSGIPAIPVGLLALTAVLGLIAYIRVKSSEFAVTNKRLIVKMGFISRKTIELLLKKVETVAVDQGILDRILKCGSITIVGTGGTKETFESITDPIEFRRQVHMVLADL